MYYQKNTVYDTVDGVACMLRVTGVIHSWQVVFSNVAVLVVFCQRTQNAEIIITTLLNNV